MELEELNPNLSQDPPKKEKLFPFTWNEWDSIDILYNSYYQVVFLEDFGIFKRGERFTSVSVDYSKGIIEAYNETGDKVEKTQAYRCFPVTELKKIAYELIIGPNDYVIGTVELDPDTLTKIQNKDSIYWIQHMNNPKLKRIFCKNQILANF